MHRRIYREDEAEEQQARDDRQAEPGGRGRRNKGQGGERKRVRRQKPGPTDGGGDDGTRPGVGSPSGPARRTGPTAPIDQDVPQPGLTPGSQCRLTVSDGSGRCIPRRMKREYGEVGHLPPNP